MEISLWLKNLLWERPGRGRPARTEPRGRSEAGLPVFIFTLSYFATFSSGSPHCTGSVFLTQRY